MSANPALRYPNLVVGDRVRVVVGGLSDLPYYRFSKGTVIHVVNPRLVEVRLDNHSFPAVFSPEDLELEP
jgi:hypothetical protein